MTQLSSAQEPPEQGGCPCPQGGIPQGVEVEWDVGYDHSQSALVVGFREPDLIVVQMFAGQYDPEHYPDGIRAIRLKLLRVVK